MDLKNYNVVDMDFCGHSNNKNQFNGQWSNMRT